MECRVGWIVGDRFVVMGSFFILGDFGVLSATMTDEVPVHHLGKILGIRYCWVSALIRLPKTLA